MKKMLCFIVVLALLFGGCSLQEEHWDYRPMIFFNDAFYGETHIVISAVPEGWTKTDEVTKQVPSHEPPLKENGTSNSLYAGTPIYTNPKSPKLIYAEIDKNKFNAYELIEEDGETVLSSSVQSEDPSSELLEESEPVFVPKGVVGTDYVIWENLDFEEGVFGTEDDLEKWKAAVKNTDGITKITVQHVECENRYLSEEEVLILLSELQSIFPSVYEEFENPATGGSYSVAAYGENGEMVWAMSHGGYFTVYLPEYENLLYFNGNDIYFDSLAEICSYRTPMSSP